MQWAIVALSNFLKVQDRLCEEIRAHLHCLDNVFDFSPHADAQVYAVPERLLQSGRPPLLPNVYDYKRGNPGYVYPLNTSTTRNPCHRTPSYHDPRLLGQDATEFDPDRWIDATPSVDHHKGGRVFHKNGRALAIFSYGRCPGQEYAMSGFRCFIASLVSRFAIELEDPSREVRVSGTFNLTPTDAVRARFKKLGG